jgi:hypothetical protein
MKGSARLSPVAPDGRSRLSFTLSSSGVSSGDAVIALGGIAASVGERSLPNILQEPFNLSARANSETEVGIPVQFPAGMPPGRSSATLSFSFLSTQQFTPSQVEVSFAVQNWVQSHLPYVVPGLLLAAAVVALLVVLAIRLARGSPVSFVVLVQDEPVGGGPVTLSPGRELYLNEVSGQFSLLPRRNARAVARFAVRERKLSLGVVKADRFPKLKELPPDARGQSFVLRSENGRNLTLKIQSKEREK